MFLEEKNRKLFSSEKFYSAEKHRSPSKFKPKTFRPKTFLKVKGVPQLKNLEKSDTLPKKNLLVFPVPLQEQKFWFSARLEPTLSCSSKWQLEITN